MKRFKFKMNLFIVIGLFMIVLFPPESMQVVYVEKVKLVGQPVLRKNSVRYGHYWIEFPNESLLKLKLMESKFECIDLGKIINEIDSGAVIHVTYTKMFLFGLIGDNTILYLKVNDISYVDNDCIEINSRILYLIISLLFLLGVILLIKDGFK